LPGFYVGSGGGI